MSRRLENVRGRGFSLTVPPIRQPRPVSRPTLTTPAAPLVAAGVVGYRSRIPLRCFPFRSAV